jgi:basic amino acid/polyamine antiporter, APA family
VNRTLNLKTTIALVIGGVIGSGIFMKPATMALQVGSPYLLISVWVVAGIITLFGALSNAELASMYPETGGQYVFFQKIYGNFFAYLYGWAAFAVINTAGNASIAYVFAQYSDYVLHLPRFAAETEKGLRLVLPYVGTFYPLENFGVKLLTIVIVLLLTALNAKSVANSGKLQQFLTALKILAIGFLIVGMAFSKSGSFAHFTENLADAPTGWALVSAYSAALVGAFWAYDGWNNITFVAGEIINPQKNISKSLFIGLTTCMLIYVLINLSYIYMLPIETMSKSSSVAADAATVAWGAVGGVLISLMVALSTLGASNANVLATARVTYTFGQENERFNFLSKIDAVSETPISALWTNAIWSCILIVSGSFDMLTDMLVFVTWFFYGSSALGLLILRFKEPNTARPYRVWGYPIVPLIFVCFTFFFLITTLVTDINNYITGKTTVINAVLGAIIVLFGLIFYKKPK